MTDIIMNDRIKNILLSTGILFVLVLCLAIILHGIERLTESGVGARPVIINQIQPEQPISIEPLPEPEPIPEECRLKDSQLDVVRFSYRKGQPFDVGYTLAAIALKESNAGMWNINLQDPSAGYYHVTTDKVLKLYDWADTKFNHNRAAQAMIDNPHLSARLAIEQLLYWKGVRSGDWMEMWASYNAGTNGHVSERGLGYAEDIRSLINQIQRCGWVR